MDDRVAVATARMQGLVPIGTLGILDLAARAGLADLCAALGRLRGTNFRCRPKVMEDLVSLYNADNLG